MPINVHSNLDGAVAHLISHISKTRSFGRPETKDAAIVSAVITMGKSLKYCVIAESVETEEQLTFLQAHRCEEGQGFYFNPAVAPEQFAEFLAGATSSAAVRHLNVRRSQSLLRQTS
jgi:EAL domain-containing protein (putative c-di-GMP-specific phosphodiesterase class I)